MLGGKPLLAKRLRRFKHFSAVPTKRAASARVPSFERCTLADAAVSEKRPGADLPLLVRFGGARSQLVDRVRESGPDCDQRPGDRSLTWKGGDNVAQVHAASNSAWYGRGVTTVV